MKVVEQSVQAINWPMAEDAYSFLEFCGKKAWLTEKGRPTEDFLKMLIEKDHGSVLEHLTLTVLLITSRTVTHALARHRAGVAITQESTQYCNYSLERFGNEITFARPALMPDHELMWREAALNAEVAYFNILNNGGKPQDARTVLPGSVKTEFVMTCNIREWRHILRIRALMPGDALETRNLMQKVYDLMAAKYPVLFEDLKKEAK